MPRKKSGDFDQCKYIADYARKHYKRVELKIRLDETDVINKLDSVESKNAYILNLIKKDIQEKK